MARLGRLLLGLAWLLRLQETQTFSISRRGRWSAFQRLHRDILITRSLASSTGQDEGLDDPTSLSAEPKSQMNQFIADFLQKQKEEIPSDSTLSSTSPSSFTPTHLIALPVDACHELTLELESVQRAILYHAPILVHACIVPANMRMPLLYVKSSTAPSSSTSDTSRHLHSLVQQVLRRHVGGGLSDDDFDQETSLPQPKPLLLEFATLEIDGSDNAMLSTVAQPPPTNDESGVDALDDDPTTTTNSYHQLLRLVHDLEQTLQDAGYQTMLPMDEAQQMISLQGEDDKDDNDTAATIFRPRIPFMRLPSNWNQLVRDNMDRVQNRTTFIMDGDDGDDDVPFIPSELGGNGISPIFWGKWMDDTFAKTVRMRQVAIYPRRRNMPQDEESAAQYRKIKAERQRLDDAFYLPERFVELPMGNAALARAEKEFEDYQTQRFKELEQQLQQEYDAKNKDMPLDDAIDTPPLNSDDPLLAKTRDRLEKLFQLKEPAEELQGLAEGDSSSPASAVENISTSDDDDEEEASLDVDDIVLDDARPIRPENPNAMDDWTRERIRNIIASRAKVKTDEQLSIPKQKPDIRENAIFQKYKNGTLVPKQAQAEEPRQLPPFPSREHAVGFWKVLRSPTGFDVEEGDESRSDNLVLRVDGTVSGGPILDQETRQKASGGTWKLLGSTPDDARIRIRLVIPPKKERILVMEGKLERISFSSDISLARGTFGIPELELLADKADSKLQDLLHCSGSVIIEDAVTGNNRIDIGKFSLTKLNTPVDPKQFTITVPRPVGFQD